jgi:hypothetical protein
MFRISGICDANKNQLQSAPKEEKASADILQAEMLPDPRSYLQGSGRRVDNKTSGRIQHERR